jgi:ABC-type antimicrobial peptide transport system permease subunit
MFKNHFTVAFRNFWRNKTFSFINVLGLSIGISSALVIFLIVYYEKSYDRFEKDGDRIYRVVMNTKFNGMEGQSAAVPAPLSSAIQSELTGFDETVPVMTFQGDGSAKVIVTNNGGNEIVFKKQEDVIFTNPQYFQLLPFQWIAGSQQASLKEPFTAVLSESRAQLYFPDVAAADVIGKPIKYNDVTVTVSGIVKDLNEHTSFNGAEFISFATIAKTNLQNQFMMNVWNDWMSYSGVYVKIAKGNTAAKAQQEINSLLRKYNKDAAKDANNSMTLILQPLNDVHFNSVYASFNQRVASRKILFGLTAIGVFLLLLGCINFINLTTAQASHRAKEIGIRKTMGSSKKNLVFQFLSETFFITIIATLLSIAITPLLLKIFSDFIPPGLKFELLNQPSLIVFLVLLVITVSFLSGLYPALILSGFKPVLVLKNQAFSGSAQTRNAWVRKTLTVSQFVIAQFFVIATVMISKQISYSINMDMGFNKEAVIYFDLPRDTVKTHAPQLMNEIKALPGVAMASSAFLAPAEEGAAFANISYNNGKEELSPNAQIRWGDPDFINLYQIKLIAGRNVLPSDTIKELVINESYAHALGFINAADALNIQLKMWKKSVPVVGIMKDFHDLSVKSLINPVAFGAANGNIFHVKLKANNDGSSQWKSTLSSIEKSYKQMYPGEDFNFKFMDETIAKFYKSEGQTANLLTWATGLTILISCLGMLGLVIYTTNTRTKEIGIRKILGASASHIVTILSKDFVKLVLIAFVIAAPAAWWAVYKWLQDYAYKTSMSWWVFVLCGLFMLIVALITLSIQTIKAAVANPVKSLRTE